MQRQVFGSTLVLLSLLISASAQVNGSGTANYIPIWTNSSALGNSTLFENNGMVGIGNTTPAAALDVVGQNGMPNSNAPFAFSVTGGTGGRGRGAGGSIVVGGGIGGQGSIDSNGSGAGGTVSIFAGPGGKGFIRGGTGGLFFLASGTGGSINAGGATATGGSRATIQLMPGTGAQWSAGSTHGGNGGSITLQPGAGGTGTGSSGNAGSIVLAPSGGHVGIGTSAPANTLEVAAGGTTLADSWTTRSSRRLKTNIQPLVGALEKVTQLRGVSYDRKADGKHEIGVVAEDVAQIVPEVVSHDPNTHEVEGVDYSRMSALLIEAIKSQQAEIQQLKAQIEQLRKQPLIQ